MDDLYVYRHKTDKNVYLMRNYNCVGGSCAYHFYSVTNSFRDALKNVLSAKTPYDFENHLRTPYSFMSEVDDTLELKVYKDFNFDGYTGRLEKKIMYHLCDFEKVYFTERRE